jgi:methionyl-tRNA formyltransferase
MNSENIVICADHEIGYDIVNFLYKEHLQKKTNIVNIFINDNKNSWWKSIKEIEIKGIAILEYSPEKLSDCLNKNNIDYLLLVSWKHIISSQILSQVKRETVNFHYSILPKHKGVNPVNWSINNGDDFSGVTIHLVNSQIDNGKIIGQSRVKIEITDDSFSLLKKIDLEAYKLFLDLWSQRNQWSEMAFEQFKLDSYHSRIDYESTNEINLSETVVVKDFINFLRSRTFRGKSSAYFWDSDKKKKVFVQIKLVEE